MYVVVRQSFYCIGYWTCRTDSRLFGGMWAVFGESSEEPRCFFRSRGDNFEFTTKKPKVVNYRKGPAVSVGIHDIAKGTIAELHLPSQSPEDEC